MARLFGDETNDDDDSREKPQDSIPEEVHRYLTEQKVRRSEDPLVWWEMNGKRFPRLAPLAREVLCVPATSTPSERVFSTSGLVVDQRRSLMTPKLVDALVFLHRNMHLLEQKVQPPSHPAGLPEPQSFIFEAAGDMEPVEDMHLLEQKSQPDVEDSASDEEQ